jgi:WD40 repeat protein
VLNRRSEVFANVVAGQKLDPTAADSSTRTSGADYVSWGMAFARFAYDRSGSLLVCVDQAELLAYSGVDEHPTFRHTCEAPLVAVGTTVGEVVAVDERGKLWRWETSSGARLGGLSLEGAPRGLSVARDGTTAVLFDDGVAIVSGGRLTRRLPVADATSLALSDDGTSLAVGDPRGRVQVLDTRSGGANGASELGGEVRGVCWNVRGFWLATVGDRVFRVSADGKDASSLHKLAGRRPTHIASSADGGLFACQLDEREVDVIALPQKEVVGTLRWQRPVEGLAFGPDVWLGVGLDKGDGNKINLATGACHRTDTHPGRSHQSWEVLVQVDKQKIKDGRSTANPTAEQVRAKLAEKAAARAPSGASGVRLVIGLVIAVALCAAGVWFATHR